MTEPRVVRLNQIQAVVTMPIALEAVRTSLQALADGTCVLPEAIGLEVPGGDVHVKGGYLGSARYIGFKVASAFPGNAGRNLPANNGFSVALDARTGIVAAFLLDEGWLTEIRTAAAGALAAELLSRPESTSVALVGAGVQAGYQLEALRAVRPICDVRVWSRSADSAGRFAREHDGEGLSVRASRTVQEAVEGVDIVITATPSREPLVRADWLSPGTHVTAMGSDGPGKQELDIDVLTWADVVVADAIASCVRLGELQHVVPTGRLDVGHVVELSGLVAGRAVGRTRPDQITLVDQCGLGIYDAAMVDLVMRAVAGQSDPVTQTA